LEGHLMHSLVVLNADLTLPSSIPLRLCCAHGR